MLGVHFAITADQERSLLAAADERFDAMDTDGYAGAHDDADFAYTWENFLDVRSFYDRAAKAGRAVLFTAS